MLHELRAFRHACARELRIDDLTVVLAIRLHARNPWTLERLEAVRGHYSPLPKVLVVDFGSEPGFAEQVARTSKEAGFHYVYVDDRGTFSLAKARNAGAAHADTPLLFFNDVDCFAEARFFDRLIEHAQAIEMGAYLDQVINVPVYHLEEQVSAEIWSADDACERSRRIARTMTRQVYAANAPYSYVDPSSNFFLIRRDFFDLVGGYNESFRGHGSEDFEFFLRLAHFTTQFPLPKEPARDIYSPVHEEFYAHKEYRGFRRYCELMALQAETAGLRICHLYHPRGNDSWYQEADRGKRRLVAQVQPFLEQPAKLLDYDWMPRRKNLLVLLKHLPQYQYFLPLRLAGYRLSACLVGEPGELERAAERLGRGEFDAVAVFNPYMNSHRELQPLVDLARARHIPLLVTDRGMLPESWFYAEDMPYADSEFTALDLDKLPLTDEELRIAEAYVEVLRKGTATLEQNGDFEATLARRGKSKRNRPTILVPLQLEDDVAVTRFNEGFMRYQDFVSEVAEVARTNPNLHFFVKPHPLSGLRFSSDLSNVTLCDRDDNIHALIELSDTVICYNSGVGFLALVHEKPIVTVGNAFYNLPRCGTRANSFASAVRLGISARVRPSRADVTRYVAWLLFHKYAFCKSRSVFRNLTARQVHNYRDLLFYKLPFGGSPSFLRASAEHAFDPSSYAAGKLAIRAGSARATYWAGGADTRLQVAKRKLRKLIRDPRRFVADSALSIAVRGRGKK